MYTIIIMVTRSLVYVVYAFISFSIIVKADLGISANRRH